MRKCRTWRHDNITATKRENFTMVAIFSASAGVFLGLSSRNALLFVGLW